MNINFGMDNFYVRYLKRFLASEMPQTNMVLGEFDKDDQQLLIQYLNLPNVESMSKVQRELNKRFPQLKTLFIMDVQDNYITWTSKSINHEASEYVMKNIDEISSYCKSVGWELKDAHEWVNDLMDINSDGKIDEQDRRIMHDLVYNNHGYEIVEGRISGKLICPYITDWSKLNPIITLYNSYNQKVAQSSMELTNHSYLFKDLSAGTYSLKVEAEGFLPTTIHTIYVKTGYISNIQDINLLGGDFNDDNEITQLDIDDITTHYGNYVSLNNGKYDLNKDGIIDIADIAIVASNKNKVAPTFQWKVNQEEMESKSKYPSEVRRKADINMDGVIDHEDLDILENYLANGRIHFSVKMQNRKNRFPNKDMLVFINQFDGTFLYDYAVRDGGTGVDNFPHKNKTGLYKLALYKCKPNQKITIAHNHTRTAHLVIGSSSAKLKQDVTSFMLQNVVEIDLGPRRKLSISSKWY